MRSLAGILPLAGYALPQ